MSMMKMEMVRTAGLTVLAASLAAAFGSAMADDEVLRLTKPESSVRLGAGYLNDDVARFGQYSGLKSEGLYGIADLDMVRRDDTTGTWLRFGGRNLGLESRELRFEHERQGDWRYSIGYSETPRYSQYIVNTGLRGIGTSNLVVAPNGVDLRDVRLRTKRKAVTLSGQTFLENGFDVQFRFKNETKQGARLFGRGTFGGTGGQQFLAEPIDHTMRQLDLIVGYTGEKLQLSGGYYGSFFTNDDPALNITGGSSTGLFQFSPIALPPDNDAHQLYLTGGYSFTPTTRTNFKLARTIARQTERFIVPSDPGRSNLGGKVVTTLAQVGFTARPMPKLSVLANLRYEDRDDQTPEVAYFTPTGSFSGTNEPRSLRTIVGKVEGTYRMPAGFSLTGGVDYDERKRNSYDTRLVSFRAETDETSYRVELRRGLSENLNGSVAYIHSERDGSTFLDASSLADNRRVAPIHLANRDREKIRARLDWMPLDPLSVQLLADYSEDDYGGGAFGLDKGRTYFWSVDAAYTISEDWQAHGYVSREDSRIESVARSGANDWRAHQRFVTQAFGLGVRGAIGYDWKVGADLQHSRDRAEHALFAVTGPTLTSLPDVRYSVSTLKIFAEYAMEEALTLRFDAAYDRWKTNDWLWEGASGGSYRYTDGTTLSQDDRQTATFVGASIRYNWR